VSDTVRLDKWLYVARVYKTRSLAKRACDLGRVRVGGSLAKAHRTLVLGDTVEARVGDWQRVLVVQELRDKPLPKAEVPRLFDDQSPPRPEPSELERLLRRAPVARDRGLGRPSKKDRRELDRLRDKGDDPTRKR
jgi:ribosome-associated heat shock protein Hsp15